MGISGKFLPDAGQKFAGGLTPGKNFYAADGKICRKDVRLGLCAPALEKQGPEGGPVRACHATAEKGVRVFWSSWFCRCCWAALSVSALVTVRVVPPEYLVYLECLGCQIGRAHG